MEPLLEWWQVLVKGQLALVVSKAEGQAVHWAVLVKGLLEESEGLQG